MTRVESTAPAVNAAPPFSTSRREIPKRFILVPRSSEAKLRTPECILYSEAGPLVYRRQRIGLAARLIARNDDWGETNDWPEVCAGAGCGPDRRACIGAGLSLPAGKNHRAVRRGRARRRHRPADRQHAAGELWPALRGGEPHRRRGRDRYGGSGEVAAGRLHAADDVEHPDRQ